MVGGEVEGLAVPRGGMGRGGAFRHVTCRVGRLVSLPFAYCFLVLWPEKVLRKGLTRRRTWQQLCCLQLWSRAVLEQRCEMFAI